MLAPLPHYHFRPDFPGLWAMARHGVRDVASVIPQAILTEPAVQLPGPGGPLVVADPSMVREVLNDREHRFTRDRFLRRLFRRSWGAGIAAAEGEDWQRQRRAASTVFRPQAVDAISAVFAQIAGRAGATWPTGEPIELTRQSALIVAEIVFSVLIDGADDVDAASVAAHIPAYIRRIAAFGVRDFLPLPERWHDRLSGIDSDPAVVRLRALARQLASPDKQGAQRDDLIAKLKGVGPIEDNILGLFPAAIDTTVAGISWTLYTLALRPDWQTRIAEETRGRDQQWSLSTLPVTRRVVQEALRLYPPAPATIRSSAVDGKLGDFRLKKGQPVLLSIYAMHRHRMNWERPDEFDPDRFLSGQGTPAWMPFGAGPRVCLAAQFALTEIVVIVARLLSEMEFEPSDIKPQITLQVTTRSATGLNVVARARKW